MKRPPGIWFLLTIVGIWLCIQDVDSVRATSLIFGKTTTTTTSTESTPEESAAGEEGVTEVSSTADGNTTKPTLTGIPQIDYIWDPNLPRELNGYNLSEYPFYDGLPDDITFKCDGLHDGFYASVPHKCQVYHHCLFGTRYDFLCANYTAFDQKTFICHFVSEVDCVNSKNFWHRNDDLYQAATTTTVKPPIVYTLPPVAATPAPIQPILQRRPGARRPGRPSRRRPQYDYYEDEYEDDYYEERRVKKRPRYRPRPLYKDEEEDYEEEVYPKRRPSRRRPHDGRRRNNDERSKSAETEDDYVDEEEDTRRRPSSERRRPNKRRPIDDEEYDRSSYDRPHKRRRPSDEDYDDPPPRRTKDRRKNQEEEDEEEAPRPRKNQDARKSNQDNRNTKPQLEEAKPKPTLAPGEEPPLTKAPLSVYERKRPPPKIRPPAPVSKSKTRSTTPAYDDEEYYDDEEEIKTSTTRKPPKRTFGKRKPQPVEEYDDEEDLPPPRRKRPEAKDKRVGSASRKRPIVEDDEEEYDDLDPPRSKEEPRQRGESKPKEEQRQKEESKPRDLQRPEPIVKVVKRPFLPSRGGSPFTSRGLLPVGLKAEDKVEEPEDKGPVEAPKFHSRPRVAGSVTNRPVSRINVVKLTTTTEAPKSEVKDPLDIDENEYDVTLNDALNPTIPNLPVRNFPTGFSASSDNYNSYNAPPPRQRYIADPTLNQASSDYVYSIQPVQSRYVPVYQPYRQTTRQQTYYAGI